MKLARSLNVDHKDITEMLKLAVKDDNDKCFWVGKNTLKKWRALARENLEFRMRNEAIKFIEDLEKKNQLSLEEVSSKLSKGKN